MNEHLRYLENEIARLNELNARSLDRADAVAAVIVVLVLAVSCAALVVVTWG